MKNVLKVVVLMCCFAFAAQSVDAKSIWTKGLRDIYREHKEKKAAKAQSKVAAASGMTGLTASVDENGQVDEKAVEDMLAAQGFSSEDLERMARVKPASDPECEWSQYETKAAKVQLTEAGLSLESKKDGSSIVSVNEFAFLPEEDDFELTLVFVSTKAEEGKDIGVAFDYENENNFKAIVFGAKSFMYYSVENGVVSVIKRGFVKPGKFISTIDFRRTGQKLDVLLNGLEVTTIKRVQITNPTMGVIMQGKRRALLSGYIFEVPQPENGTEESTSDL